MAGQADIFLGNGFDDFLSKPIDVRQLNAVLNKFIRDKQPPEIIEAARKSAAEKKEKTAGNSNQPAIDPKFAEIFARDALKAIETLEAISKTNDYGNEDNMRAYIINVHGMKSALANIGKMDLSAVALKLEMAARECKLEIVTSETSGFLSSLRAFVEDIKPLKKAVINEAVDEDKPYLFEKLLIIKAACEEYDESTAEEVLKELRETEWSQHTEELLGKISEQLLCSDFDEIVDEINELTAL